MAATRGRTVGLLLVGSETQNAPSVLPCCLHGCLLQGLRREWPFLLQVVRVQLGSVCLAQVRSQYRAGSSWTSLIQLHPHMMERVRSWGLVLVVPPIPWATVGELSPIYNRSPSEVATTGGGGRTWGPTPTGTPTP